MFANKVGLFSELYGNYYPTRIKEIYEKFNKHRLQKLIPELRVIYLKQLKHASAYLENLLKNRNRRIYEHITKNEERLITQIVSTVEDLDLEMNQVKT